MLTVIDKQIDLPVMIAKPYGKDENNNVLWRALPLPSDSPGLTEEAVEAFKELREELKKEEEKAI